MTDYPFQTTHYAFTVCRIEPENNLHLILQAFASPASTMFMTVVGNWNNSEYGRNLRKQYGKNPNIFLLDPIYEPEKLNGLRGNCTLYLHGHSCGGTNPSLVEAMSLGLSIAAFDVNFNRETTENQALYFKNPEELNRLVTAPDFELWQKIGKNMQAIAMRRYTWERISRLYETLF